MKVRVAVASSDGKFINQHFGHATQFLIFDLEDEAYEFIELRETDPPCNIGEHDDNKLTATVKLLLDCRLVLTSQIGPGANFALANQGIKALQVRDFIDEALTKVIKAINKSLSKATINK